MQEVVERVIATMWKRHGERLSLEEMANTAVFSRFYFSRIFRTVTGTSPGRFLTAIRLYNAKQLLAETALSVTEISYQVGYNSLGTFTTRFTNSVGMSPARYRFLVRDVRDGRTGIADLPPLIDLVPTQSPAVVEGTVTAPECGKALRVYVGAFASPIPQGLPVACDVVDGGGQFRLTAVPPGDWYLHTAAVAIPVADTCPLLRKPLFVGDGRKIRIRPGNDLTTNVTLHPVTPIDMPLLFALPELDRRPPRTSQAAATMPGQIARTDVQVVLS